MNEELEVLRTVAQRLSGAELPYMFTGSIASNYYTIPRMTRDLDIVIELGTGDVDRFASLFEHDFYADRQMIADETRRRRTFNLIHHRYVIKVDFILRKDAEFHRSAFSRRREVAVAGDPVWMITAEDLVIARLLWARDSRSDTQLKDVRGILGSVAALDRSHVDRWVRTLGLEDLFAEVQRE